MAHRLVRPEWIADRCGAPFAMTQAAVRHMVNAKQLAWKAGVRGYLCMPVDRSDPHVRYVTADEIRRQVNYEDEGIWT